MASLRRKKDAPRTKKAPAKNPSPPRTPGPVGVTSGVGVNETWIAVFETNEQIEEKDRLTDAQISQHMKAEFPDLEASLFDRVEIARGKYNRGGFHRKDQGGQRTRPKIHSKPFAPQDRADAVGRASSSPAPSGVPKRAPAGKHHKDFKSHKR